MMETPKLDGHRILGSWSWQVDTGMFTAGPEIAEAFCVAPERARLGAPIVDFFPAVHPEDRERFDADVARAVETRTEFFSKYRVVARNGAVRHLWDHGRCLERQFGLPDTFLGVIVDVTETADADIFGSSRHLAEARRLLAGSNHKMLRYFIDMAMVEMETTINTHARRLRSLNS